MHDSISSALDREVPKSGEGDQIPRPEAVSLTGRSSVFCPWCQEIVTLVNAVEAAGAFNTDLQDVQYLLSRGDIHALRQDAAIIAICRSSLEKCFETRRTRLLDSHFELKVELFMSGEVK